MKRGFRAVDYWRDRLVDRDDLDVVGHRSLGHHYNAFIYQRRLEVLRSTLGDTGFQAESSRILELGCGGGFYVGFWKELGVRNLVGVDLSTERINKLRGAFPDYHFVAGDISGASFDTGGNEGFDLVTLFDVLYHIVDDQAAQATLEAASRSLSPSGTLLVFDLVHHRDVSHCAHVRFRAASAYQQMLSAAGLRLREIRPLFALLAPPIPAGATAARMVHGAYWAAGLVMKASPTIARALGRTMTAVDRILLKRGWVPPNSSLLAIEHEAS